MKQIVQKEDPVLRQVAEPLTVPQILSKEVQNLIDDLHDTLASQDDGVGLAAPQIGQSLRIFVVSPMAFTIDEENENGGEKHANPEKDHPLVYINPEIIKTSRKRVWVPEGCLSVRWLYGNTQRAEKVTIRAYNEQGKLFTRGASGLIAHIYQHEVDHLNGILFIDHAKDIEEIPPEKMKELQKKHA